MTKPSITYDLPDVLNENMRFMVKTLDGQVWNRRRRRFDPVMDLTYNLPYHHLGHAQRGARLAAEQAKADVVITLFDDPKPKQANS